MRRRSAHPDFHNTLFNALKLFDENPQRDVVSYNVLIDGLVKAREVVRARELFDSMPFRDLVSWNSLIAGWRVETLLGRAGLIEQAGEMIEKMPKEGGNREKLLAWSGLLGLGFRIHGNMDMVAEKAAERVKDLSPEGVYSDGGDHSFRSRSFAAVTIRRSYMNHLMSEPGSFNDCEGVWKKHAKSEGHDDYRKRGLKYLRPQEAGWTAEGFNASTLSTTSSSLPLFLMTSFPHVYTAILVDGEEKKKANLLSGEDFEPALIPDKDKKPEDWDKRAKIPDPNAVKPDDWDEDAPMEIEAEEPEGWMKRNPAYKGKWSAPLIDNPAYKGIWNASDIPKP
ncbi:unnamed protein product [Brassica oleracea var. botrytis]|uniref:Calreticulin n=1 Tax=Brassica oleracea TaxID=3712 RepID=A0A3P6AR68_BRAOL|nr:unnamed protein product [Brassica oleracea]